MHKHWSQPSLIFATTLALAPLSGCQIGALVGGMAESFRETGERTVEGEYLGLSEKIVAVIVAADRSVQATNPSLVPTLTNTTAARIATNVPGAKVLPPSGVLQWQYNHPRWPAMSYGELAEALGAERLVVVDLLEFRLHEPGNAWLWDGRAVATIGVVEADGALADDFSFSREVNVRFPDQSGYTRTDLNTQQVLTVLSNRLINRTAWLFYDHKEPYYPEF